MDIQRIDHSCGGMSVRVDGFYTACVLGGIGSASKQGVLIKAELFRKI